MTNPTEEMLRWSLMQATQEIEKLKARVDELKAERDHALIHAELRALAARKTFERVVAHSLAYNSDPAKIAKLFPKEPQGE